MDADFVVWDPNASFVIESRQIQHRHKLTPYAGMTLKGVVKATYLRGELICDGEAVTGLKGELISPQGKIAEHE